MTEMCNAHTEQYGLA